MSRKISASQARASKPADGDNVVVVGATVAVVVATVVVGLRVVVVVVGATVVVVGLTVVVVVVVVGATVAVVVAVGGTVTFDLPVGKPHLNVSRVMVHTKPGSTVTLVHPCGQLVERAFQNALRARSVR